MWDNVVCSHSSWLSGNQGRKTVLLTTRLLSWFFILMVLIAAFILGQVLRQAGAATYDPFVQRLEMLFGVSPGRPLPVDMRAPDIRLQYRGTTPTGHGCYEVNICRYR